MGERKRRSLFGILGQNGQFVHILGQNISKMNPNPNREKKEEEEKEKEKKERKRRGRGRQSTWRREARGGPSCR